MMRVATMEDLSSIMEIIRQVIEEMHSYNNFQWDEHYPQEKDFALDIQNGDLFVATREREKLLVLFVLIGLTCLNIQE